MRGPAERAGLEPQLDRHVQGLSPSWAAVFLVLETIISRTRPDGSSIVVSTSRHIPIKLPGKSG